MKDSAKAGTQGRTDLHLSLESRQSLELVPESLVLTQNPALLCWVDAGPANRRVHLSSRFGEGLAEAGECGDLLCLSQMHIIKVRLPSRKIYFLIILNFENDRMCQSVKIPSSKLSYEERTITWFHHISRPYSLKNCYQ